MTRSVGPILRDRLAAMPAIAALTGCCTLTLVLILHRPADDPQTLRRLADQDFDAGRFEVAALRYQHCMAVQSDAPEPVFRLALTMDRLHRRAEAMQVLALIAPLTGGGYGPAHLQQAEWLIEAHVLGGGNDAAALAAARQHLSQRMDDDKDRARAAELLTGLGVDSADRH